MKCQEALVKAILHPEATDPYGFPTDRAVCQLQIILLARQHDLAGLAWLVGLAMLAGPDLAWPKQL